MGSERRGRLRGVRAGKHGWLRGNAVARHPLVIRGKGASRSPVFLHAQRRQPRGHKVFHAPPRRAAIPLLPFPRGKESTIPTAKSQPPKPNKVTSSSLDAFRMYCLSLCILSLNRYIATARPPIWAEDANPGGPVTSPTANTQGFDVRKELSTCLVPWWRDRRACGEDVFFFTVVEPDRGARGEGEGGVGLLHFTFGPAFLWCILVLTTSLPHRSKSNEQGDGCDVVYHLAGRKTTR